MTLPASKNASCSECNLVMNGQECAIRTITVGGTTYDRLPFTGAVCGCADSDLPPNCHDCGVRQGGVHHAFCCLDYCPIDPAHGQTLTCGHGLQDL